MRNINKDVASILYSNAQYVEGNSIWVGINENTPKLTLSSELRPPLDLVVEHLGNFLDSLLILLVSSVG